MTYSLPDFLEQQTLRSPDKTYIVQSGRTLSYEEVTKQACQVAHRLVESGIKKGDHVALMLPNSPEYVILWFGLAMAGAVTVTPNTLLKGDSLAYILTQSDSKLLIMAPEFEAQVEEAGVGSLPRITFSSEGFSKWLGNASGSRPDVVVKGGDPFILTYTSGTTGMPKGVLNSHNAYIAGGSDLARYTQLTAEDRIYTFLPLYHANPQIYCILGSLSVNASVAIGERFSASRFWDEIRAYGATAFSYVGAVLPILLKQPEKIGEKVQPPLKCFGGGAPKEVHERFTERFGVLIHELYGMSETGGWNTMNLPVHEKFGGNVGKVREGFDVRVFDGEDNELPAGTAGEIVIRPNKPFLMFNGYYKRHEETIRDFRNLWFHTGDMGMTDEDGYFYFLGRMKENIRRGGENISPLEIDKVILEHPAVSEVAAVGVSDEIMGEEIKVYIVTKPGESVSAEEIISICQQRLASFMVPRYVEFTSALPKTGSEKIQRGELKKLGVGQAFDRLSDVS
jgi:crotonobetaine/carnitine-CoA ligase